MLWCIVFILKIFRKQSHIIFIVFLGNYVSSHVERQRERETQERDQDGIITRRVNGYKGKEKNSLKFKWLLKQPKGHILLNCVKKSIVNSFNNNIQSTCLHS